MDDVARLSALANDSRLSVMRWLRSPKKHFPPQHHADIEKIGVCCSFITEKLGIAPATTTRHMQILAAAGFVSVKRMGKFTYYKRVDAELKRLGHDLAAL